MSVSLLDMPVSMGRHIAYIHTYTILIHLHHIILNETKKFFTFSGKKSNNENIENYLLFK